MFFRRNLTKTDNSLRLDSDGVIRLTYKGPQTRETLRTLTDKLLKLMAEQRSAGKTVKILADMRQITHSDSSARVESKWFLEETDWDVLGIIGNRYLQPLIFFVLRDFKNGKKIVKYFTDVRLATKWMANPTPEANFNRLKPHNNLKWITIVVLIFISAGTIYSWLQARDRLEVEAQGRFETARLRITETIEDRIDVNTEALNGFRGLFHSSDAVNEKEYHDYFASLEMAKNHPGLNSANFVSRVKDSEKTAFVESIRRDRSLRPEGDPNFVITPESNLEEHFVVTYVGVEGAGSGRGIDLAANKDRAPVLQAARDSGEPTATNTIRLLDEQGQEQEGVLGFLITIPVYKSSTPDSLTERRSQHEGFVNAVFNYNRLFDQSLAGVIPSDVSVKIFDNDQKAVYQRNSTDRESLKSTFFISVAGREWRIEIQAPKLYGVSQAEAVLPSYVAALGFLVVVLLAAVLWLQNRGRKQAIDLASDMTEDIKLERNAAIATKNKDEAILSSIGDGVLVLDNDGRVVLFNKAAEQISGLTSNQVVGKPYVDYLDFLNEKTGQPASGFIEKALSGIRSEMAANTILKRVDGGIVPVSDSAAPVYNAIGQVIGAVVIFRDTTRERQLEQMKDELLSVASHELRTPMGAVRANIAMILDGDYGPVNDGLVEPLTDIKASTVRLVELVNDLLSVARLEAGRMKFTLSEFDIQQVIGTEVNNLTALGKEKGVQVVLQAGEPVTVQADADKVKQVLNNLIGNALKFTDQGSITVAANAQKDKVEVSVTDTGIGIAPDDQKKLFSKFQQISSVQGGKPAGTGLGLYISRTMTQKMGGDLRIKRSEPGKGSTFVFTLPLVGSTPAKSAKQALDREAQLHPDQK